jgi:hypothetical protein
MAKFWLIAGTSATAGRAPAGSGEKCPADDRSKGGGFFFGRGRDSGFRGYFVPVVKILN